jgi:uncharacterized protein
MRPAELLSRAARLCCAIGLVLMTLALPARAQDVLPVPALTARVIDQTATLDAGQRSALESRLAALEQETGTQLVVLLLPTTQPEDIAAFAQRVGDEWKIGRRDVGDGLLIVAAMNDRKVRIEVAKTLEGAVPDLAARRIITEQISPAFKRGDYAGGLNSAVDQLAARIKGEALPAPDTVSRRADAGDDGIPWEGLLVFFFAAAPILGTIMTSLLGRKLGALATGGAAGGLSWLFTSSLFLAGAAGVVAMLLVGVFGVGTRSHAGRSRHGGPVIWGGGGSGSGGWGSGGGFSSGGGGDFGGGGASGDW